MVKLSTAAILAGIGTVGVAGVLAWQRLGFGNVDVESQPSNVPLTLDSMAVGDTPFKGRLPTGQHTLSVPATIQTVDSLGNPVTATFDHWFGLAGSPTTPTATINIVSTSLGDPTLNTVTAIYNIPGQVPPPPAPTPFRVAIQAVGTKSSGDTEFLSVKAHVISRNCTGYTPFGTDSCNCHIQIAPYTDMTLSDFETSVINNTVAYPSGVTLQIPGGMNNEPITFQLQVLAIDGTPVPNAQVKIWWTNPTVYSQIFNGNMFKLVSTNLAADGENGTVDNPILRTSDANGFITISFWPGLFNTAYVPSGTIESYICADQKGSPPAQQTCNDALCVLSFGAHAADCGPHLGDRSSIGASGSDWVCTNNGAVFTPNTPKVDIAKPTLNAQCVDFPGATGIVLYSITMEAATKEP